jgi:hypothetical protein
MKNKKNKQLYTTTKISYNLANKTNTSSKYISFKEEKNDYSNKKYPHYYIKKLKRRQINSLDELTKKFMKYVLEAGTNTINLNEIMKKMKVKKRRIYDITNVLEGK